MGNYDRTTQGAWHYASRSNPWGESVEPFASPYVSERAIRIGASNNTARNRADFLLSHGHLPVTDYTTQGFRVNYLNPAVVRRVFDGSPGMDLVVTDRFNLEYQELYPVYSGSDTFYVENGPVLIAKLHDRIRNVHANYGEALTEVGKTCNMVLNRAKQVGRAVIALKKGKLSEVSSILGFRKGSKLEKDVARRARHARTAADAWLEYRYGWLPLYSDIYGTMTSTWDMFHNPNRPKVIRARTRYPGNPGVFIDAPTFTQDNVDGAVHGVSNTGSGLSFGGCNWTVRRTIRVSRAIARGAMIQVESDSANHGSMLGLTNPIGLAWELLPLSFVADWFINVGDCLNQFSTLVGKRYIVGYETFTKRWDVTSSMHSLQNTLPDSFVQLDNPGSSGVQGYIQERVVNFALPTVLPRYELGVNLKRAIDAVGLTNQRLRFK